MIQLEMIDRVRSLAQHCDAISAVLMYGSFIKDEGDEFSDIEFYIFTDPGKEFDKRDWVNAIEEVALFFVNEFGTEVTIFRNLVRGEFHFLSTDQMGVIRSWAGIISFEFWEKMILIDKEDKLSSVLSEISKSRPERSTRENILWIQDSLINNLLFTKNLLLRKEWGHAHQSLFYLHKYLLWLIRIRIDATLHWESPTKKAEEDLPAEWYNKYAACTSALDKGSLEGSFSRCCQLARELFVYFGAGDERCALLDLIENKC